MRLTLRSARLILGAACAYATLCPLPLAHGQASAADAEQSQRLPNLTNAQDIFGYEAFLHHLGDQNDLIQKGAQAANAQTAGTTDYAAAIGIDPGSEQSMIAILLDAYHQEKETAAKWGISVAACRVDRMGMSLGSKEAQDEAACVKENLSTVEDAKSKLMTELGERDFEKVDAYIRSRGWDIQPQNSQPCNHSADPLQGETPHKACDLFYEDLFTLIAAQDQENRKVAAGGEGYFDERLGIDMYLPIPEDKRQAVISLSLETYQEMNEADHKYVRAAQEFNRQKLEKYGPNAPRLTLPPEITSLWKHRVIVKRYITKLKQTVGDNAFLEMDEYLSHRNVMYGGTAAVPPFGSELGKSQHPGVQQ